MDIYQTLYKTIVYNVGDKPTAIMLTIKLQGNGEAAEYEFHKLLERLKSDNWKTGE